MYNLMITVITIGKVARLCCGEKDYTDFISIPNWVSSTISSHRLKLIFNCEPETGPPSSPEIQTFAQSGGGWK